MRLTVYSDDTLRVLMYLALCPGTRCAAGDIARAYGMSRNHPMKVVHHLGVHGYAQTVPGKGGGLRLGPPPTDIRLGEVLRATERGSALVECFGSGPACPIWPACGLAPILSEAEDAFFAALDRYTVADLLESSDGLAGVLGRRAEQQVGIAP